MPRSLSFRDTCRIKRATSVKKFTPPLCVYDLSSAASAYVSSCET